MLFPPIYLASMKGNSHYLENSQRSMVKSMSFHLFHKLVKTVDKCQNICSLHCTSNGDQVGRRHCYNPPLFPPICRHLLDGHKGRGKEKSLTAVRPEKLLLEVAGFAFDLRCSGESKNRLSPCRKNRPVRK